MSINVQIVTLRLKHIMQENKKYIPWDIPKWKQKAFREKLSAWCVHGKRTQRHKALNGPRTFVGCRILYWPSRILCLKNFARDERNGLMVAKLYVGMPSPLYILVCARARFWISREFSVIYWYGCCMLLSFIILQTKDGAREWSRE